MITASQVDEKSRISGPPSGMPSESGSYPEGSATSSFIRNTATRFQALSGRRSVVCGTTVHIQISEGSSW